MQAHGTAVCGMRGAAEIVLPEGAFWVQICRAGD